MGDNSQDTDRSALIEHNGWTRKDYILLALGVLISFGNGVELYLPGVITQYVSCDLGVSKMQEGWLGCGLYLSIATTTLVGGFLSDNLIKRKETILLSLYGSSLCTILSAAVGDYYTLLICRVLIGNYLGLNLSVYNAFVSERASSKQVHDTILLQSSLVFTLGGVWIPTLGYFLLDMVGWQPFLLITSLPVFIPSIFILHFLTFTAAPIRNSSYNPTIAVCKQQIDTTDFRARLCKVSLLKSAASHHGWGVILLLPALMLLINTTDFEERSCEAVTRGLDLLLLALVNGGAVVGMLTAYLSRETLRLQLVFTLLAAITVTSYTGMILCQDDLVMIVSLGFVIKFTYGFVRMSTNFFVNDERYLGARKLPLAAEVATNIGMLGGAVGVVIACFAPPWSALLGGLVVGVLQTVLASTMCEQDRL